MAVPLRRDDPRARDARAGQTTRRTEVLARLAQVEEAFGDPWDPDNPIGFGAVLSADDEGELPLEGMKAYERLGLNAEFVPERLGGRLLGLDALGLLLRPLFRRDVTFAVGAALTSFMAAVLLWIVGDEDQQRRAAAILLDGGTLTIAFQQFAHGNDFVNDEFLARRTPTGLRISGSKAAVNNITRADLLVAFARTGPLAADSHSILLVAPDELPADRVRHLDRHRTDAVPGLHISGLAFDDCALPDGALVGVWGRGVELGLRAYPATHATVPAMLVGLVDTALRTATRFAQDNGVSGRPVARVAGARNALAGTFVDLLVSDCLALTATRALHVIPEQSNVLSAVVKYLVPKLVGEALNHLSVVLGDSFHAREGDYAIFRKHLRDLDMITFGHVSSAMCQATIAPCLPGIADAPWTADRAAPDTLFLPYGPVPPLDPARLAEFGGEDGLAAYACVALESLAPGGEAAARAGELAGALRERTGLLVAELAEIRTASRLLDADGTASDAPGRPDADSADSQAFPVTDRYALALAAVCCLGVWLNADPAHESFSAGPQWLVLALDRLLRRLGVETTRPPAPVEAELFGEVLRRADQHRSYDLYDLRLSG